MILRGVAVLALYGVLSHAAYSATSDGLSSSIDSEGFTAEQKRALQQTAMAKLSSLDPILSSATLDDSKSIKNYDAMGGEAQGDGDAKGGNAITTLAASRGGNATSQNGTAVGGNAFANKIAVGGDSISHTGSATGGNAIAGKLSADEIKQLKELGML